MQARPVLLLSLGGVQPPRVLRCLNDSIRMQLAGTHSHWHLSLGKLPKPTSSDPLQSASFIDLAILNHFEG